MHIIQMDNWVHTHDSGASDSSAEGRSIMIEVIQGDITELEVDAIVKAANTTLLSCGPVHGITTHDRMPYPWGYSIGQSRDI